jgi:hypothetical protein
MLKHVSGRELHQRRSPAGAVEDSLDGRLLVACFFRFTGLADAKGVSTYGQGRKRYRYTITNEIQSDGCSATLWAA